MCKVLFSGIVYAYNVFNQSIIQFEYMKPYVTILILLSLFLLPAFVHAQPRPPGMPVPLDGGIVALLAAGVLYGVKKYRSINQ